MICKSQGHESRLKISRILCTYYKLFAFHHRAKKGAKAELIASYIMENLRSFKVRFRDRETISTYIEMLTYNNFFMNFKMICNLPLQIANGSRNMGVPWSTCMKFHVCRNYGIHTTDSFRFHIEILSNFDMRTSEKSLFVSELKIFINSDIGWLSFKIVLIAKTIAIWMNFNTVIAVVIDMSVKFAKVQANWFSKPLPQQLQVLPIQLIHRDSRIRRVETLL